MSSAFDFEVMTPFLNYTQDIRLSHVFHDILLCIVGYGYYRTGVPPLDTCACVFESGVA